MADINKEDIKLLQSQRLDDTDQGGGQMTKDEVQDGEVNNLFPDISRLDRVYGRVSMRKAYLAVQTSARETYYGSHTILTRNAGDPNVSVCFFSNEDWFDTREEARDRIEAYLVKGPNANIKFWGNHYKGTSFLKFVTNLDWPVPEVGDVLVLNASLADGAEQYVRVIDVSAQVQEFISTHGTNDTADVFNKLVIEIEIGTQLEYDMVGTEVYYGWDDMSSDNVFTTVAADASRYYGVADLQEDCSAGELLLRVDDIQLNLVPSAASETAITDAGVGQARTPLVQTQEPVVEITRSIQYNIKPNAKLYIGEGVLPGTFSWTGGININDGTGQGNIYNGSTIVGSIDYITGIITFGQPGIDTSGTGTAKYTPACAPTQISETGAIVIDTNNRGFVYTFNCNPIPQKGTLKIDYLAGGKWYSIWDQGDGQIKNSLDDSIGSGSINFLTGSVSVTLGAMPDVDSSVLFFWAKPAEYYDFSGEILPLRYKFLTNNEAVARNTFKILWQGDANGPGPGGAYGIMDNGNGNLSVAEYSVDHWVPTSPEIYAGKIKYATGEVDLLMGLVAGSVFLPVANEVFEIDYNYGSPFEDVFAMPPRDGQGRIYFTLTNTPIIPSTFKIEWHTDLEEYDPETRIDMTKDPTYIFKDDGAGNFEDDVDDGTTNWIQGTVDYTSGDVYFMPDRTSVFPFANYEWKVTTWMHPGVEESYVFSHISYLPAASLFPTEGTVTCWYCTLDGANAVNYTGTLEPIYFIKENSGLELSPGGLSVRSDGTYMVDGLDGKLYTHVDGVNNDRIHIGNIHYINKTISIISDNIDLENMEIVSAVGTGSIDPTMSMVFRAPGAPIRPGSAFIRATTGAGTILEGISDFSGDVTGTGIFGHVDFNTGLCHVGFGEYVPDDAWAQSQPWYNASTVSAGNVWKPFSVRASTILMNCVITSYLPLDPDLLGLDPVRLPLDGKVPIFRDGYIIVIHDSNEQNTDHPLSTNDPLTSAIQFDCDRNGVDLVEVYAMPTLKQLEDGTQVCAELVPEVRWDGIEFVPTYTIDLGSVVPPVAASVQFQPGFPLPKDTEGTPQQLVVMNRIEDMCLASDVQVTGHIAITSPLVHDYTAGKAKVSSVLPSADLQSRAYNEFEQSTWNGNWEDYIQGVPPLASFNFVDYPIAVINKPSIKERWMILFQTASRVQIVGENFGVLAENVNINPGDASEINGNIEYPVGSGNWYVGVRNRNFSGDSFPYYFLMDINGFGLGWSSGNNIRFNQDAANFPLWFIRTTLQAPPQEPVDHYTIQIRGDSS